MAGLMIWDVVSNQVKAATGHRLEETPFAAREYVPTLLEPT